MADTNAVTTREKLLAEWQRWSAARITEDEAAKAESLRRFDPLFAQLQAQRALAADITRDTPPDQIIRTR